MHTRAFLLTVTSLVTIDLTASKSPTLSPKSDVVTVYTAESARNTESAPGSTDSPKRADNLGFVDPNDFSNSFSKIDFDKADEIFPDFFNTRPATTFKYDQDLDDGSLTLASGSNYKTRRHDGGNENGFVDPNVQFRSLYDAAETEGGFFSKHFPNSNPENSGTDTSKSSQTKAYPSYTYTGRNNDDHHDDRTPSNFPPKQPPRFKSNYRQVNNDGPMYNDRPNYYDSPEQNRDNGDSRLNNRNYGRQPFNRDDSARGHTSEESAEARPASPASKEKTEKSPGKGKCKKVVKEVDDAEEYDDGYQADYDPSTYQSRYKRQAGRRSTKRPMTCFVCEDDQGRYAERCSYESNSEPGKGKGNYFHSTSTSFNDNGKKSGRGDRHKRDPPRILQSYPTPTFFKLTETSNDSLPKRIQKRQSNGHRYASDFQEEDERPVQGNEPGYYDYSPSLSLNVGRNGGRDGGNGNPNRILDVGYSSPETYGEKNESPGYTFDFSIPKEFQQDSGLAETSNAQNRPGYSPRGNDGFGRDFDVGYDDYVRKHFPEAFREPGNTRRNEDDRPPNGGASPPTSNEASYNYQNSPSTHGNQKYGQSSPGFEPRAPSHSSRKPEYTPSSYEYSPVTYFGAQEVGPQHLEQAINNFNQKDRKDCAKIQRGDMSCYVCRESRGGNKEECMYASNPKDPRNGQMAYHEVSEYSSQPKQHAQGQFASNPYDQTQGQVGESKKVEKVTKATVDYDFDY